MMMSMNATSLKLLLPTSILLEPEQIEQARAIGRQGIGEVDQWQAYLNALALLGFEQWLNDRLPEQATHPDSSEIATFASLQVGEFKLCLLTTEHVLDELIAIPQAAIDQPEHAAHFYVVLEAIEEQEELLVRGFGRYDQLMNYCRQSHLTALNGHYPVPLSLFDPEPNHLLFNCRYLEPASIALPEMTIDRSAASTSLADSVHLSLQQAKTKLSQWLDGAIEETWQAIDALINPSAALALGTRSLELNVRRGKILDLGVQLGSQSVALLITVIPETENKLGILVQLHPTREAKILPPYLKLTLLSKLGKVLQEVESRQHDSYIQLKSFKGEPGKHFSLEISSGSTRIREHFEL
ncbi:MAG: hypothetical protein Kow00121_03100 [Elainellaceae cyanobacterium]